MYPITYPPKHPPKYPLLHKATPRPEPGDEIIEPLLVDSIFDFKKVDYTTFESNETISPNLTDITISFALPAG
jgi:hypothetical protein